MADRERVDPGLAMENLFRIFNIKLLASDTRGTPDTVHLESGLIDDISIAMTPVLSGDTGAILYKPSLKKEFSINHR